MLREYTHELGQEVRSISGRYELEKEDIVELNGKKVLYVVGSAVVDGACCGYWGCRYVVVPGFVISWKSRVNREGLAVSVVSPVRDRGDQELIRRLVEQREYVHQIEFW